MKDQVLLLARPSSTSLDGGQALEAGLQEVVLFADRSLRLQITSFMVVCLLANYGTCCFIPSACLVAYRDKRTRW